MSKYEEVCSAFANAQEVYRKYERECSDLLREYVNSLLMYLGTNALARIVKYYKLYNDKHERVSEEKEHFWQACTLENDTFFHIGIGIIASHTPHSFPKESNLFELKYKIDTNVLLLELPGFKKSYKFNTSEKESVFNDINTIIVSAMIENYNHGLENFLNKVTNDKMGFI